MSSRNTQQKLGDALRTYRTEVLKVSQREFARLIGYSAQWVSHVEAGMGSMQPATIGSLKKHHPTLWNQLVQIYIDGTKEELGLTGEPAAVDPRLAGALARVQKVLEASEHEVRKILEETESEE